MKIQDPSRIHSKEPWLTSQINRPMLHPAMEIRTPLSGQVPGPQMHRTLSNRDKHEIQSGVGSHS